MSRFNEIPLSSVRHVQALADQPTQSTAQELKAEFDADSEVIANVINVMVGMLNTFEPSGTIVQYAGRTAPNGWLMCDGSEVPKSAYPELYQAIGDTYGIASVVTNFVIPNFKGRVPVGLDISKTEFNSIGKQGGETKHVLTIPEMPTHKHGWKGYIASRSGGTSGSYDLTAFGTTTVISPLEAGKGPQSSGGGQAHNNMPPYLTVYMWKRTA
jgi:microcystin-dependent protein